MPARKASKKALKVKRWVPKKGWVIKTVKNPVVFMAAPSYPPVPCTKCHFYPCYADAYGSYHCPRCSNAWQGLKGRVPPPPPPPTLECPYCGYCPVYCKCDVCRCPHCGASWSCPPRIMKKRTPGHRPIK